MRTPDGLPMRDVGHVQARADDILESCTRLLERAADVAQRLHRLRVRIAGTHDLAARVRGGRARNVDDSSDAYRAGIADDRLPRGAAREVAAPLHHRPSKPGPGGGAAFHVMWDGAPVDRASRMRSSVARTISSTAC